MSLCQCFINVFDVCCLLFHYCLVLMITFSYVLCLCARVLLCLCPMSLPSRVDVYLYSVLCHFSIVLSLQLCPMSLFSYLHVHIIVLSVFMCNVFAFCVVVVQFWSCCFLFFMSLFLPFSSYRERLTFFRVVSRLKHSCSSDKLARVLIESVNVYSVNISSFDNCARETRVLKTLRRLEFFVTFLSTLAHCTVCKPTVGHSR